MLFCFSQPCSALLTIQPCVRQQDAKKRIYIYIYSPCETWGNHLKTQASVCTMDHVHPCITQSRHGCGPATVPNPPLRNQHTFLTPGTQRAHALSLGTTTHQHQNECTLTQVPTPLRLTQFSVRQVDHPAKGLQTLLRSSLTTLANNRLHVIALSYFEITQMSTASDDKHITSSKEV